MAQYSTKMIFAVLDVSFIMGLNIGETDKVFYINLLTAVDTWSTASEQILSTVTHPMHDVYSKTAHCAQYCI